MDGLLIQSVGAYTVVEFHTPSLMDAVQLQTLADQLYKLVGIEDRRWIVLDFEKVEYVSSQFIGILMVLNKRLAELPKSKLILCGIGPKLQELLHITRLDRILDIRPTQEEAVV